MYAKLMGVEGPLQVQLIIKTMFEYTQVGHLVVALVAQSGALLTRNQILLGLIAVEIEVFDDLRQHRF